MPKINWAELLIEPPKYGLMSAQEPPDVYTPEPIMGCNCPDCSPQNYPQPEPPQDMSQDAYNLARISRGEEGKTAYFYFPDMKKAPKTIVWLWSDGFVSVHEKKPGQPKLLQTTKEWWDKSVMNAPWPSKELIEDLYSDVFVPRYTKTYRYQIIENEKKYHKITSKNLLADPIFVAAMVERMHDAAKLTDLIDEWTNSPKPKSGPKKTGNTPKSKIPLDVEHDGPGTDNPFEVEPPKYSIKTAKMTKLDENGNPVGKPVNVGGVTIGTIYEDEIHNIPSWASNVNVSLNLNGSYTVIQPPTMNWNTNIIP